MSDDLTAPVQGSASGRIAWPLHELAWQEYARRYPGQTAKRLAERGGFSWAELVEFLPAAIRAEAVAAERARYEALVDAAAKLSLEWDHWQNHGEEFRPSMADALLGVDQAYRALRQAGGE